MTRQTLLAAVALMVTPLAVADDSPVYESFQGVTIGRVFLSQDVRDSLDKRRLEVPRRVAKATGAPAATRARKTAPAAGYIVGPDGRPKTWRDGDFVEAGQDAPRRMSFPGDVAVKRHLEPDASADDGGGD